MIIEIRDGIKLHITSYSSSRGASIVVEGREGDKIRFDLTRSEKQAFKGAL